jgi:hypothetical protein
MKESEMAESEPPAAEPTPEASKAQAEFARYKDRVSQPAGEATGAGAPFASPVAMSAIPAWSLQRPPIASAHGGHRQAPPSARAPSGGDYASIIGGVGTTIRLGVEALNAALSSGISMLSGVAEPAGWGQDRCGCDVCIASSGYDCCSALGCGSACCEPSVGTCC